MITFDNMHKISILKPEIIKQIEDNGYIFEYSDFCFVKGKYGYIIARYMECKQQKIRYWVDNLSSHPINDEDEWHLISDTPTLSMSIIQISDFLN